MNPNQIQKTKLMLKLEEILREPVELWLDKKYSKGWNSYEVISDETKKEHNIKINPSTFSRWSKKFNIKTRKRGETQLKGKKKPSKEKLDQLYNKENKSMRKIAKQFNVDYRTIYDLFNIYNMQRKSLYEGQLRGRTKPSDEELTICRIVEGKNFDEIGRKFDFYPSTIRKWVKQIPEEIIEKIFEKSDFLYPIFASYKKAYNHYLKKDMEPRTIKEILGTARITWFDRNKILIYSPKVISSALQGKIKQDFIHHRYSNRTKASKKISELLKNVPLGKKEKNSDSKYSEILKNLEKYFPVI